jgi:hypothetical protein
MRNRIQYITLHHSIPADERQEVNPCPHCGARLYLEGTKPLASSWGKALQHPHVGVVSLANQENELPLTSLLPSKPPTITQQ